MSPMTAGVDRRVLALLVAAIALPLMLQAAGQPYYVGFVSRVMIFALVASSLNLLVGFGGLVSFGHAAFFGIGAYAVGILAQHGVVSALAAWPLAVAASGVAALLIGVISLRTRGLYFIMITLAFAQMLYYLFISLKAYGGDDGINLAERSVLPGTGVPGDVAFYYVVLACLAGALWLLHRLLASRFGAVMSGIRENETRMEALGYPTFRYRLACFILGGAAAGLAGALMVNQNGFVSPNLLHWTQSGQLLIMVILGGIRSPWGGAVGAATFLLLEEVLSGFTEHWSLGVGVVLLLVVLRAPHGITGLLSGRSRAA